MNIKKLACALAIGCFCGGLHASPPKTPLIASTSSTSSAPAQTTSGVTTQAVAAPSSAQSSEGRSIAQALVKINLQAKKLDANNNGVLDEEEKAAKREKLGVMAGYVEAALDANQDGVVTVQEYVAVQEKALRDSDKDKNGYIDEAEEKQRKKQILKDALLKLKY